MHTHTGEKVPLPLPKTHVKKPFSTMPVLSSSDTQKPFLTVPLPPTPNDDEDDDNDKQFSEIKTMFTLGQGYELYDQLPQRNRPLPISPDEVQYGNLPAHKEEGLYDIATEPLSESEEHYDDVVGTYGLDEADNCYDEIVDRTEVDENNYGIIRCSNTVSGRTDRKPLPKNFKVKQKSKLQFSYCTIIANINQVLSAGHYYISCYFS